MYTHALRYIHTYIHTHTNIHTYIHTYTHTHTHTHTHQLLQCTSQTFKFIKANWLKGTNNKLTISNLCVLQILIKHANYEVKFYFVTKYS